MVGKTSEAGFRYVAMSAAAVIWLVGLGAAAGDTGGTCVYEISHPEKVLPLEEYHCSTFHQDVHKYCEHHVRVTVTVPSSLPRPGQTFPLPGVPEEFRTYLQRSPHVQSDHPAVRSLAERILASAKPRTEEEAVAAVLVWTSTNMTHAFPNEVPDAVTCIERRRGNCIGFTHVATALLRHMGIPARTVRTLSVCPNCGKGKRIPHRSAQAYTKTGIREVLYDAPKTGRSHFLRHSIVEVYYPEDRMWVLYEPQTAGPPNDTNIYLKSHHDWDVQTQRACRAFSRDARTVVEAKAASAAGPSRDPDSR